VIVSPILFEFRRRKQRRVNIDHLEEQTVPKGMGTACQSVAGIASFL
jgi:hypothetical protein